MIVDEAFEEITKIINPVYLVGGAVRDYVMGNEPNDFDFTTSFNPDEIVEILQRNNPGRHIWENGRKYGTIATKLYLPKSNQYIKVEVTTFRSEVYTGSRKPDVEFVEHIEQDLSRRDFTINAMAKRNGKIIDPFGGMGDIANGIIRAVGHPRQRFNEDPLRIMRAARFTSTLGFSIEDNTFQKMKERAHKLLTISKERICAEMDKILLSPYPTLGLNWLMIAGCMPYIIPELAIQYKYNQNNPHHSLDLWEHTLTVVDNIEATLEMRWAALFHDIAKPFVRDNSKEYSRYIKHDLLGAEMVERIANHLKWSSAQKKAVKELVEFHMDDNSPLKPADRIGK